MVTAMIKVGKPQILYFKYSDRKRLVAMFEEWTRFHNVLICPESFASWLWIKGYLNIDEIMDDFKMMDEVERGENE
jgi:hypothetical protein